MGWRGTEDVSFQAAVTAVLIEGAIFFVLAVTGVRYAIIKLIPEPVRLATPAAIGFFLAHLGLQTAEGIGVVSRWHSGCFVRFLVVIIQKWLVNRTTFLIHRWFRTLPPP